MALLIERKKADKRKRLLDAAYECFISEGVGGASIARICEQADIAKGTFYLYFKDKEDIAKSLNMRISYGLLEEAYTWMKAHRTEDFVENCLVMADYIINRFEKDTDLLKLLRRDFTWTVSKEELVASDDELIGSIRTSIRKYAAENHLSADHLLTEMFALTGMVATVCYSAIIDHYPCTMEEVRPVIFEIIRKTLKP
ncbi:MAG: TetR/AcrR family transcriptional regulator [Solobacterium sp.]|jgi:AcrR family transcriptional regulator|nr:TetR/AcrR family transcriptional regulator [Solobacterium sp.]MCH4221941.1 TetR/AcrR family transcriptional regulator [Solobacterium sp.]MCH4265546.1 TetR/AcrR family transcriptional regulator [Solobacterium sp.]